MMRPAVPSAAPARLTVGESLFLPAFTRTQFPLLPACTLTDRQAQGMTLDAVIADVRRAPGRAPTWPRRARGRVPVLHAVAL